MVGVTRSQVSEDCQMEEDNASCTKNYLIKMTKWYGKDAYTTKVWHKEEMKIVF